MKSRRGVVFAAVVGLLMGAGSLWAHHSDAVYNMTQMTIIKGTVTEHLYVNPHQLIKMKVQDTKGKVTPWILVGANVSANRGAGWTKDTLRPGDEIKVYGFAYRDGRPSMTWMRIVNAGGKMLPMPPGAKNDKLARYMTTYGKEQLSPEDYEVFKKSLNYTDESSQR
jgi:hypothetical protein